ncbi:MAG: ABC transporter permease [Candidatus Poseidoniaceae archaeon]
MEEEESVLKLGPPPSLLSTPIVMSSNLHKQRNLVKNLVSRDFKVNYHGHFLGYLWSLLEPLALTGIFVLVFIILRGQTDTLLPLKIMIGILIFNSFAKTLSNCTTCLIQNSSLIKQVYFPREVFPTAIAAFRFTSLCLSMIIIVPYMIYENIMPTKMIFLLPLAMVSCTLLGQGLGMIAAVIQVRIRDLKQVIDLLVRAGFFLSGVFFGAEIIPENYLDIYLLNPIAVYIEMARGGVLGDWGVLDSWVVFRSILISVLFFFYGSFIFMRYERKAVKYI